LSRALFADDAESFGPAGRLSARDKVRLVSLTADPEHDTVEVLRTYGERFEADAKRWHF
jgi:cytochrome oxidase Cu insertion factor (SCO1/SenC/PrrC family)